MENVQYTLVVTSCKRHELLKKTLASFIENVDIFPIKTVIVEDSDLDIPDWLQDSKFDCLGDITWISNGKRNGQIYTCDRLMAEIETEYIFWSEDDWEFTRIGFIAESFEILEKYPNILQVWMRDDSEHPVVKVDKFPFPVMKRLWNGAWSGFSFNPGLRRLSDYHKIGSYGRHVGYDPRYCGEKELSLLYDSLGFYAAKIDAACKHIGWNDHVAWETAPKPPKVLIAIPACHKYEYQNHADGRVHQNGVSNKRVEAVRNTWQKYMPAFKSYVDMKFFYGHQSELPNRKPEADEVFLDVADDYKSLPHKVQAIYKYALANGYDYVFKGDDDTFIYVDRLMASDFENYDYSGYCPNDYKIKPENVYASGGSGYWMSRKAMQLVVNATVDHWAEDLWVGSVLYKHGIKAHRDARYLPGFWEHFTDLDSLGKNHSYISFHACTPRMMEQLFEMTVNPSFKIVERALHEDSTVEAGKLDYELELDKLLDDVEVSVKDEDLKTKINKSFEILTKRVLDIERKYNVLESRIQQYNTKSSHKI